MKLLAHRGHWLERAEMNSFHAFERAWSNGYGIETDLRDLDGAVVISHDPPARGVRSLDEFLAAYAARGASTPLALNVKERDRQDNSPASGPELLRVRACIICAPACRCSFA